MYGGSTTLYGFLTEEEKNVFTLIKESVPGTGATSAPHLEVKSCTLIEDAFLGGDYDTTL